MSKKMSNATKVKISNAKHNSLRNRAKKNYSELNQQKSIYHGACIVRQKKLGRVLTRSEREKVYDDVIRTFW